MFVLGSVIFLNSSSSILLESVPSGMSELVED